MEPILLYPLIALGIILISGVSIVRQGMVAVVARFGKYSRILYPGLNFRIPLIELVVRKISLQNRSVELEFQAITSDQANVHFKTLILYAVGDHAEDSIHRAAFKFIDQKSFMQALIRIIEGSVRSLVATKKQSEILSLRNEIVMVVHSQIDESLKDWGFKMIDLQVNDIGFDEAIMRSMAQVVATNNLRSAAENEAQAQYITKTRVAEAEARAKLLIAEAEKEADRMRGEGNAALRKNIADGLVEAGNTLNTANVNQSLMLFTMWLDGMKYVASHSKGNIISFDASNDGFEKTFKQMTLISTQKSDSVG